VLNGNRRAPGCWRGRERCLGGGAVRAKRDGGNGRRRVHALENRSHDASLLFFQVKSQLSVRPLARQLAPLQGGGGESTFMYLAWQPSQAVRSFLALSRNWSIVVAWLASYATFAAASDWP